MILYIPGRGKKTLNNSEPPEKPKLLKLFKPFVSEKAKSNCIDVLNSSQLAEGEYVKRFESLLRLELKQENVLALNSGTSALEMAYELAGIGEGDEVITPVLTCTATNIPLLHRKAKIVFADIDYDLNINVKDVERKITDKTKAVVFVHFGGNSRGLSDIQKLCKERGIIVIEDAAQAIGTNGFGSNTFRSYDNWGTSEYTCVSLQAIKTLTSGDGGLLICKNKVDHEKAKRLRWFGYDRDEKQKLGDTDLTEAGYKKHMNNISAAIGVGNLREIYPIIAHRRRIADIYKQSGMFAHIWLAGGFTDDYEGLKKRMNEAGYEIGQHHFRNDKYTIFKEFKTDCPIMDELENKYFFVPLHHEVTEEDARNIIKICQK